MGRAFTTATTAGATVQRARPAHRNLAASPGHNSVSHLLRSWRRTAQANRVVRTGITIAPASTPTHSYSLFRTCATPIPVTHRTPPTPGSSRIPSASVIDVAFFAYARPHFPLARDEPRRNPGSLQSEPPTAVAKRMPAGRANRRTRRRPTGVSRLPCVQSTRSLPNGLRGRQERDRSQLPEP